MKRILFLVLITLVTDVAVAQPKQRRSQQQTSQQQKKNPSSAMSIRAQISFPTAVDMPEDVVWRRDIYREIDLTKDANAGLYYPVQPEGKQMNLFTYIFKLIWNCFVSLFLYLKYHPDYIVTTGVHTAGPMCCIGKLFGSKIIYIETFANIVTKTATGRLLYPISDLFVVQWKSMKKLYPDSVYGGWIF